MDRTQTFKEFLATQSPEVPLGGVLIDLFLAAITAWLIGELYVRFGRSLSDRRSFARNFLPLAVTTTLVITIVKSSLALSLGLVGALSIVRFRAAIKEPEELAYLFLAIGVGLGLGADQRAVTLVAAGFIGLCIILREKFSSQDSRVPNLFVTVSTDPSVGAGPILERIKEHAEEASLVRLDEEKDRLEICLVAAFEGVEGLTAAKESLRALDPNARLSFVENESASV